MSDYGQGRRIRAEDYWKGRYQGRADAFNQAAQMLEERLNGSD